MTSRASNARHAAFRAFTVTLVLVGLAACWELYRYVWSSAGWTWPFPVDSTTMPHLWTIAKAFGQPAQVNQPALITILLHKSLFTAKEAAVGFAIGAVVGFALGIVLAHSRLLQRGFLPYIVASQTIPILAIAPMVVVWVNPKLPGPLQGWGAVAVIAAYLTFFPVVINTLRGLHSADPRALDLMRTYAAGRWKILWKLRVPASLPFVFSALRIAARDRPVRRAREVRRGAEADARGLSADWNFPAQGCKLVPSRCDGGPCQPGGRDDRTARDREGRRRSQG